MRDWTYDIFYDDLQSGKKGSANEFTEWLLKSAHKFEVNWKQYHRGSYDRTEGYIGDAFAETLQDFFSDFYKDTYGQRPHLPRWYYVYPLGLPMAEDVMRTFCSTPIQDAYKSARIARNIP